MMTSPIVAAVGVADNEELYGSLDIHVNWRAEGLRPLGTGRKYEELFGRSDATFRRLVPLAKSLVLACAATGIDTLLTAEQRERTAVVTETLRGSLDVDLRYAELLGDGLVNGAAFPYTLQSTCVGDVAMRHGLRGPTICLSRGVGECGVSLGEAERMIRAGEVDHVLVASFESLAREVPSMQPELRSVAAVLSAPSAVPVHVPVGGVGPWCPCDDGPFETLAACCRKRVCRGPSCP